MVGVGNIVSVGGTGGGSGSGSSSGITEINSQTGPIVTFVGVNGVVVSIPSANTVLIDASSLSGLITPSGGIGGINGQIGPHIEATGINGIQVTVSAENTLLFDGAGASGVGGGTTKFSTTYTGITSGLFTHSLGDEDVIVQLYDAQVPARQIFPDEIKIENSNQVSVLFNSPQTGKIVII